MRKQIALVALTAGLASGGTLAAQASTATLSTTSRTETLVSAKCYHEHQRTVTNFHYSKKVGGYVAYVAPKTTVTDSTHCHA